MRKAKYHLSPEGMDNLTQQLMKLAAESQPEPEGLKTAPIDTNFVKVMVKVKDLDEVIEKNEVLTKRFQGLLDLYGFPTVYDMYVYATQFDILPEELKKGKDYSKLVPVKRKVMRNGKETEITVYEKRDSGGSQPNEGNSKGRDVSNASVGHARELTSKMHSKKEKLDDKSLEKLKQAALTLPKGQKFNPSADYFLELKSPEGYVAGIIGYSIKGDYITMDFYKTNGQISGIAARGFAELVNLAVKEKKGVKVADNPQARPVFAQFQLEQQGEEWSISPDDLQHNLGGTS
ncbi:hypothetical protein [Phage f2b1]|nr:hypothetical protein [Phage f2b1]